MLVESQQAYPHVVHDVGDVLRALLDQEIQLSVELGKLLPRLFLLFVHDLVFLLHGCFLGKIEKHHGDAGRAVGGGRNRDKTGLDRDRLTVLVLSIHLAETDIFVFACNPLHHAFGILKDVKVQAVL